MSPKVSAPLLPIVLLPFVALGAHAQAITGVSHPDQGPESVATQSSADHYVKPSASAAAPVYQDSFPATETTPPPPAAASSETAPRLLPRENSAAPPAPALTASARPPAAASSPASAAEDEDLDRPGADDGIVLSVPSVPHQLHRGTVLQARLRESLNTETTAEGSVFTAELTADAAHNGEVLLPQGSLIRGHVASIHGGSRIRGGASMYLRPETISLPDGTLYRLDAVVTDVDGVQNLRVNDEGGVVLHEHPKAAAAVVGGVAGTAAVAGALVGGGVGAAVGAVAGAGIGTVVYLRRDVQEAVPAGTTVMFALQQPLTVTPR